MPTQKTDIFNPHDIAIDYAAPDETWKIAKGIKVGSSTSAVNSLYSGSKLINGGHVYSTGNGVGALFFNDMVGIHGCSVINKADASIRGNSGVILSGPGDAASDDMKVINQGSIKGEGDLGVYAYNVNHFEIASEGEVFGANIGIAISVEIPGLTAGPRIDNSGRIRSDHAGIDIYLPTVDLTSTIINRTGALISGTEHAVFGHGGTLSVKNHGKIKGGIISSSGDDKVVNKGKIVGETHLYYGDDIFKGAGGKAGKIFGEFGNDTIACGTGKEKIVFDSTLDGLHNVDRVMHFESGKDKFLLDGAVFASLTGPGELPGGQFHKGAAAADPDDFIIYEKSTGTLWYDSDGSNEAQAAVQFAQLDPGSKLHASDFVVFG